MMEAEVFAQELEFEFRAGTDGGPGMLTGPVVVYGDEALSLKGRERMEPGFFTNLDDKQIRAKVQHQRHQPIAANGRGLTFRDSAKQLIAETRLPKTTAGYELREYIQEGVYTGYSPEFHARRESRESGTFIRLLHKGLMAGLGIVDWPAFPKSVIEVRAASFLAEFEGEVEYRQQGLNGQFDYNRPEVVANAGRRRKELVRPGAFDFVLRDPTREVLLTLGERADRPLASRLAGSLRLVDSPEGLRFEIDQLPDTSYARDFEALLNAGTLAYGIRALYRKPPPEAVAPEDAEEEIEDTADDAEPGVTIGAINQAILTGLAIIPRAPRGNPGDIEGATAKVPTESVAEARMVMPSWLRYV